MNGTTVINKLTTIATGSSSALKKLWEPLWRALSFSLADDRIYPARTLSVSLDKGTLSVVYGTRFLSRIRIRGVREYAFEDNRYPQPEVVASSVALAMNDLGAARADVLLSIPKAWAIVKTVEFPAAVKENLSNVISYELDRITPFSADDTLYDFRILSENEEKLTILAVAAKDNLIRPYLEALKDKGITASPLIVNLSGIAALFRHMDRKADSVFLEIKPDGYEGALFLNGTVMNPFSGSFSTEDENSRSNSIASEISSLTDYAKNQGRTPQVILLFRDKSPSLKEMIKAKAGQPVTMLNETDIRIRIPGDYADVPYAAVGGVLESLWPHREGLDLLSKGYHKKAKAPLALTFILVLAILVMWILYLIAPLRVEEKRLEEIDRQIALRKEEVKKVESLKKELATLEKEIFTIADFKERRPLALNILRELTAILPKTAWLSRLRITETTVEIEGYAASATGILSKLEASLYFQKAEFASPTFRDTRMNSDRFNIKMELEGIKKEELQTQEETDEEE